MAKAPALPSEDYEIKLADSAPIALVVEDDPDAANVAKGMLRLLGYRSRVAVDANEALYALSEGPPSLILMDICLPVMDGVNLIKVARKVSGLEAVPVVAMSAVYPEDGPVAKVLSSEGVTTFLSKPFTLNGLRSSIDNARGAALRFGPPPAPSMAEFAAPPPPEPKAAEPAPTPKPVPEAPKPAPARTQSHAGPRLPPHAMGSSGAMAAIMDGDLDFPIENTDEHPLPGSTGATETLTSSAEVIGSATVDGHSTMIIVERASKSSLTLRSPDEPLEQGAMIRLEIRHRMAVNDAMQDITIRALGHIGSCDEVPNHGWKVKVRVAAARPPEAFSHLIDYLERIASF
ncbi:MAG: response regulator [Proteobacteria bacterium]|nr:response regulator [Pseudomonadota bacterium]